MSDSPGRRLSLFRKSLGLSQRRLAAQLGVSQGRVGAVEADIDPPSRAFLEKIGSSLGVSADWLLHGKGEMLLPPSDLMHGRHGDLEPADHSRPGHGDVRFEGVEYAFVRRMALSVSAGNGLVPFDDGEAEGIAFPVAWLKRQKINADLAVLVSVTGDSMAPGIYAFNLDGESFVKRIVPQSNESGRITALAILSDNSAYAPVVLSGHGLNRMTVVGRVRDVITMI